MNRGERRLGGIIANSAGAIAAGGRRGRPRKSGGFINPLSLLGPVILNKIVGALSGSGAAPRRPRAPTAWQIFLKGYFDDYKREHGPVLKGEFPRIVKAASVAYHGGPSHMSMPSGGRVRRARAPRARAGYGY